MVRSRNCQENTTVWSRGNGNDVASQVPYMNIIVENHGIGPHPAGDPQGVAAVASGNRLDVPRERCAHRLARCHSPMLVAAWHLAHGAV